MGPRLLKGKGTVVLHNVIDRLLPRDFEKLHPPRTEPKHTSRTVLKRALKKHGPFGAAGSASTDSFDQRISIDDGSLLSLATGVSQCSNAESAEKVPVWREFQRRISSLVAPSDGKVNQNGAGRLSVVSQSSRPSRSSVSSNPLGQEEAVNDAAFGGIFSRDRVAARVAAAHSSAARYFRFMESRILTAKVKDKTSTFASSGSTRLDPANNSSPAHESFERQFIEVRKALDGLSSGFDVFSNSAEWLSKFVGPTLQFRDRSMEEAYQREMEPVTQLNTRKLCFQSLVLELGFLLFAACGVYVQAAIASDGAGVDPWTIVTSPTFVNKTRVAMGILCIAAFALQLALVFVTLFVRPTGRRWPQIVAYTTAATSTVIGGNLMLDWSGVSRFWLISTVSVVHCLAMSIFMMRALSFATRFLMSHSAVVTCLVLYFYRKPFEWPISFLLQSSLIPWIVLIAAEEAMSRFDYVLDQTLTRQASVVGAELKNSNLLLRTILPARVIENLLDDPSLLVYEEFAVLTVLHMDIAGFTSLSSTVEPMDVFLVLNTLFAYFDTLTAEFEVEKITTIGDAYIACSNPAAQSQSLGGETSSPPASPSALGAASVCLVASLMQQFVRNSLNPSPFVAAKIKRGIQMRIGVHSGPCHGAIMGGTTNFRYDLMGDTVGTAEKIQEITRPGEVYLSETTQALLTGFRQFQFRSTRQRVRGVAVFHLRSLEAG
ncbi:hypothetical protein DFJ73DRAFT_818827 [Zopfochytrium polystomum]|nr:hypothetical protein DFJ73DRAFT_818827 [Zopfochytrium polystomum]